MIISSLVYFNLHNFREMQKLRGFHRQVTQTSTEMENGNLSSVLVGLEKARLRGTLMVFQIAESFSQRNCGKPFTIFLTVRERDPHIEHSHKQIIYKWKYSQT